MRVAPQRHRPCVTYQNVLEEDNNLYNQHDPSDSAMVFNYHHWENENKKTQKKTRVT
jgi:hypothetical protein